VVFGARRGFFKEVVHALALVVGIWLAIRLRVPVGTTISIKTGLPQVVGEVGAVVVVWVVAFLVTAVVGRLLLKKFRGEGVDDNLDDAAEGIADAIAGDTAKGPLTLMTDPIASKSGVFYWTDKLLGAGLGFVKGLLTGYVLCGMVVYLDHMGWENGFAESVEASLAATVYQSAIDPYFMTYPAYRVVKSAEEVKAVADVLREDPSRVKILTEHAQLTAFRNDPRVQELINDPELKAAFEERDVSKILLHDKVQEALKDPALREKLAAIDWAAVRADVEAGVTAAGGGAGDGEQTSESPSGS
jgi:uncharacterized membrane protein required for colicin V production